MTWGNNSVFQLLIIQGSQAISGLFLYNGLGGPTNPPQFAAVASGVTQDPFGNAITSSKILIQGNVITESGGVFRTSGTSPLIQLDGPHNAVLQYDSGIHLAESIAPASTSDGLGNTVQAGFTAYGSANTTWVSVVAAGLQFSMAADVAIAQIFEQSSDGSLFIESASRSGATSQSTLTLVPGASAAAVKAVVNGGLVLFPLSVTPPMAAGPVIFSDSNGYSRAISNQASDTTAYQATGRATKIATSTPQTVNSTTGQAVTGITFPVASGVTYELDALLFCTVGPNALVSAAAVTGPATTFASFEIDGMDTKHGSLATALGGGNQTAMGTLTNYVNNGTIPVGDTFTVHIRGRFTTSAAGTIGLSVNTTAAANTYTINNGSYATLMPSA